MLAVSLLLQNAFPAIAAQSPKTLPCPAEFFFGDYYHAAPAPLTKRREFAKQLLGELAPLDSAVPELSPAERKWLAEELSHSGPRSLAASDSVENEKYVLRTFLNRCVPRLRRLAGSEKLPLREEVATWDLVAQDYDNFEYARAVGPLVEAHVIGTEFLPHTPEENDAGDSLDFICRGTAQQISVVIVVPYLKGQLPK